jgi:hypothetical protein
MALTKVKLIADGTIVQSNLHASHGITTADIGEGSNLYYTDARARAAVSVSGNALSYNSSTGVITSNFEESPTFTGTVKASTYLINTASAAGIGASLGDINGAELGPGYLIISRDDTANAKQISFYKNNVEHSYLETTSSGLNIGGGNVGIGTTSPTSIASGYTSVTTNGTNGGGLVMQVNGTATGYLYAESGALVLNNTSGVMQFYNAGSERMRIDSSGNVLINSGYIKLGGYSYIGEDLSDLDSLTIASDHTESIHFAHFTPATSTYSTNMIINSSGNVGIGTTSPSADLEVYTDAGGGNTLRLNTNFGGGNTVDINPYITGVNNGGMEIKLAGSQKLVMNPSGDVGIGTTSPSQKLEVSGVIKSISTGAAQLILNGDTNNSGDTGQEDAIIDFLGDGNPGIYGYRINTENWSGQTALHFQEYINGAYTSRLYINKDGNVGIGTTSLNTYDKLQVIGNAYIGGNATRGVRIADGGTYASMVGINQAVTAYTGLELRASGTNGQLFLATNGTVGIGTTSPNATLEIGSPSGVAGSAGSVNRLFIAPFSNTGGPYKFIARTVSGSSDFLDMYYGSNHIISYGLDGNVGIGTADPDHKLEVVGGIALRNSNSRLYFGTNNGTDRRALEGNVDGTLLQIGEGYSKTALYGNVGIATTSPQANLDVNEDLRVNRYHKNIFKFHNTTSASNQYFHIKTGVGTNQVCMHMYHVEGYAYGQSALLDERFGFHTDSGGGIYGKSYKGSFANNIYESSDNKVVLVFGPINTYYMSFMVHLIESGMYTELFVKPSAATYSSSNSGAY